MNILFICTSNKDRSPALEKYFRENFPIFNYKSAGINKYFTEKKGTTFLQIEHIKWANLIVYAEEIHQQVVYSTYPVYEIFQDKMQIVLNAGDYNADNMEEYIERASEKITNFLNEI
jgi:predicted protein tyrosine phosphatase